MKKKKLKKKLKVLDKKFLFNKNDGINSKGAVDSDPRRLFFIFHTRACVSQNIFRWNIFKCDWETYALIFLEEEELWTLVFGF